jgi:hypothetical protein
LTFYIYIIIFFYSIYNIEMSTRKRAAMKRLWAKARKMGRKSIKGLRSKPAPRKKRRKTRRAGKRRTVRRRRTRSTGGGLAKQITEGMLQAQRGFVKPKIPVASVMDRLKKMQAIERQILMKKNVTPRDIQRLTRLRAVFNNQLPDLIRKQREIKKFKEAEAFRSGLIGALPGEVQMAEKQTAQQRIPGFRRALGAFGDPLAAVYRSVKRPGTLTREIIEELGGGGFLEEGEEMV